MSSPRERRAALLDNMTQLGSQGIHCGSCSGQCCTSKLNSMQISRLEAEDLIEFLRASGRLDDTLSATLRQCVRDYRLDVELPQFGARKNIRRTYTCPFFTSGPAGCSIGREYKPYGCLAFNPTRAGAASASDGCRSEQDLLVPLDSAEDKAPIPVALLRLLDPT